MTEFGENGIVLPGSVRPGTSPSYTVPTQAKFKRIGLASFLCGLAACMLVTLIGAILLFLGFQVSALFGREAGVVFADDGVLQGMGIATFMAALNWYFAYFTVPAAWIAIGFSLGRFPRRGIVQPLPYYRWGAIWGAILVGGTTGIATFFVSQANAITTLSGGVMGLFIGAAAGFVCGAIFRAIVRPAEQVKRIQVDVF